jgi:DeoR/GlpR family transcriptional regulator of sugar metabolism
MTDGDRQSSHKRRLLAGERRRRIAEMLDESGALRIGDLTAMFNVTDETIRRDLTLLEEEGLLTRAHGGALATALRIETPYGRRLSSHADEKDQFGRAAAKLVNDGSTIIVDSGTTMRAFVQRLRTKRDLVDITNGVNHVNELLANPTTTLVMTGGVIRRTTLGAVGDLAVATLETLRADHTFIATHGFSTTDGLTYPSFEEVAVKRAMIAAGAEVTLLADGSKCGCTSMVRIASLNALNRIVTSAPIPADEQRKLEKLKIELVMVNDGRAHRDTDSPDLDKKATAS